MSTHFGTARVSLLASFCEGSFELLDCDTPEALRSTAVGPGITGTLWYRRGRCAEGGRKRDRRRQRQDRRERAGRVSGICGGLGKAAFGEMAERDTTGLGGPLPDEEIGRGGDSWRCVALSRMVLAVKK